MRNNRRQFVRVGISVAMAMSLAPTVFAQSDETDPDYMPPNLFISPAGKPFRAPKGAPYPVVDWFKQADKNGDGKLDHAEFMADCEAFFTFLDFGKNGVIDSYDVSIYEHRVVPEILGFNPSAWNTAGVRLWRVQMGGQNIPTDVDPSGAQPNNPRAPQGLDETRQGASPYSFFDEPEPVTAADNTYRGYITKAQFLSLADRHFTDLDEDKQGFLTLAKLPKTSAQTAIERAMNRGRR